MKNTPKPQEANVPNLKRLQAKIALYLILFFVIFGSVSLYLLLNSPA